MKKQTFTDLGAKHKDLLLEQLAKKDYYKFLNLNYSNVENHMAVMVFVKNDNRFKGIFYIDATDYCLFDILTRDAHLTRYILETCERLKYNSLE